MSNDVETLRKSYVDARDALEKAENGLIVASGALSRAIRNYSCAAVDFLPKSDTGLCLRLPELPDDFELVQLQDLHTVLELPESNISDYLVLCPSQHVWRAVRDGEHHVVVARRKRREPRMLENWANRSQALTELHANLKPGADVCVECVNGALVVCHGTCIYVLSTAVEAPYSDRIKLKAVYGDASKRWVLV
jgi:hypothetical protein